MKLSSRRIRYALGFAAIGYWIILFTATHLPPAHMPTTHVNDKIEHFSAYALLTILLSVAITGAKRVKLSTSFLVLMGLLIYGALDELTQPPFGRTCDIHDWYADAVGVTCAMALLLVIGRIPFKSCSGSGQ